MFDLSWSEMLVVAVIAVVVVGPKDLPRLMRTVGGTVTKVKRMGREFQRQINDAIRDEELEKLQKDVTRLGRSTEADLRRDLSIPAAGRATVAGRPATLVGPQMTPLVPPAAAALATPDAPVAEPVAAIAAPAALSALPPISVRPAAMAPLVPPPVEPASAPAEVKP